MDSSTTIKDISTLPTVFETKKLPNAENSMATVANGYLGTIVYSENLYLNGFYNGRGLNSHRAKIPSPCNVRVSLPVLQCEEIYRLDVKEAVFYHQISTPDYAIEQRIYAHQLYPQLLVCDIIIQKNHKYANEIIVSVQDNFTPESSDLEVNFSSDSSVRYADFLLS
ncbi:protein-glucosylgalactosylhydroxylysine glucosidase-like [Saccoglossus kowalevskii]